MVLIKRFLLMIQFLTAIPLPISLDVKNEDFGKGLVFAPVIGIILGALLAGSFYALSFVFPPYAASVVVMIVYIVLTGGLHLDGLGDTFDGLFSNRPKERILEIMRDSRVGTNAVLAIVSVILLNVSLLSSFSVGYLPYVLLLMPVAGRIGSLIGSGISVYARSSEGLGKSFIDYCGAKEIAVGTVIYFGMFFGVLGVMGIVIACFPVVSAVVLTKFFSRKIGGATGDILGAVCELNQTVFLMVGYLGIRFL
ncbi:MAG: adenosylcobinamide-GDP ribazoletransferase [Clostridia bacterium]|nr:adenosylcobinamide-GDP ribazoletransferase [Clostridia bacterium]